MSKKLVKYYKGVCLETIHKELVKNHAYSIAEVDELLKYKAGINKSCNDMTSDELNELIVTCFTFADKIGVELNYPNNECEFIKNIL
jgi:hypothetical protein